MTARTVPGSDVEYFLVSHDEDGFERTDDPDGIDGRLSARVEQALVAEPVTDVFFISHGWKGDVPAAIDQYDRWIGAMLKCEADRQAIRQIRPDFKALLIGLHWPSLPWGVEGHEDASFGATAGAAVDLEALLDDAAATIADGEAARAALKVIFAAAVEDIEPANLSPEVIAAFNALAAEAGLQGAGPGGAPGEDAEAFDPARAYDLERQETGFDLDFGGGVTGGILGVLRQLSFWKMKQRARTFGEAGGADLLRRLQAAALPVRDVRFHLMGHSFGCIVISACIAGGADTAALVKPVGAVYLVQGALSLWSYCNDIPVAHGKPGYFRPLVANATLGGPLVTTQSEHDTAVGTLYPKAAGIKRQVDFAPGELPKYGALGTFGAQGPGVDAIALDMKPLGGSYAFENGRIHNLNADAFINQGGGLSGAHNDIDKPEVAHAFWAAIHAARS